MNRPWMQFARGVVVVAAGIAFIRNPWLVAIQTCAGMALVGLSIHRAIRQAGEKE